MKKIPLLFALEQSFPGVSRDLLYSWTMCGEILVNGETCRNPKAKVLADCILAHKQTSFVSRGGDKLYPVLSELINEFPELNPQGKWVLDAGSSTGGFVDVLLNFGALGVYAIDVGTNQLHYKLRVDPRIRVRENTNILEVKPEDLDPMPSFCTADLSFRSVRGVSNRLVDLTTSGLALVLVKPQFESDFHRPDSPFRGVLSLEEGSEILNRVIIALKSDGLQSLDIRPAGIRGTKGNQEYFVLLTKGHT